MYTNFLSPLYITSDIAILQNNIRNQLSLCVDDPNVSNLQFLTSLLNCLVVTLDVTSYSVEMLQGFNIHNILELVQVKLIKKQGSDLEGVISIFYKKVLSLEHLQQFSASIKNTTQLQILQSENPTLLQLLYIYQDNSLLSEILVRVFRILLLYFDTNRKQAPDYLYFYAKTKLEQPLWENGLNSLISILNGSEQNLQLRVLDIVTFLIRQSSELKEIVIQLGIIHQLIILTQKPVLTKHCLVLIRDLIDQHPTPQVLFDFEFTSSILVEMMSNIDKQNESDQGDEQEDQTMATLLTVLRDEKKKTQVVQLIAYLKKKIQFKSKEMDRMIQNQLLDQQQEYVSEHQDQAIAKLADKILRQNKSIKQSIRRVNTKSYQPTVNSPRVYNSTLLQEVKQGVDISGQMEEVQQSVHQEKEQEDENSIDEIDAVLNLALVNNNYSSCVECLTFLYKLSIDFDYQLDNHLDKIIEVCLLYPMESTTKYLAKMILTHFNPRVLVLTLLSSSISTLNEVKRLAAFAIFREDFDLGSDNLKQLITTQFEKYDAQYQVPLIVLHMNLEITGQQVNTSIFQNFTNDSLSTQNQLTFCYYMVAQNNGFTTDQLLKIKSTFDLIYDVATHEIRRNEIFTDSQLIITQLSKIITCNQQLFDVKLFQILDSVKDQYILISTRLMVIHMLGSIFEYSMKSEEGFLYICQKSPTIQIIESILDDLPNNNDLEQNGLTKQLMNSLIIVLKQLYNNPFDKLLLVQSRIPSLFLRTLKSFVEQFIKFKMLESYLLAMLESLQYQLMDPLCERTLNHQIYIPLLQSLITYAKSAELPTTIIQKIWQILDQQFNHIKIIKFYNQLYQSDDSLAEVGFKQDQDIIELNIAILEKLVVNRDDTQQLQYLDEHMEDYRKQSMRADKKLNNSFNKLVIALNREQQQSKQKQQENNQQQEYYSALKADQEVEEFASVSQEQLKTLNDIANALEEIQLSPSKIKFVPLLVVALKQLVYDEHTAARAHQLGVTNNLLKIQTSDTLFGLLHIFKFRGASKQCESHIELDLLKFDKISVEFLSLLQSISKLEQSKKIMITDSKVLLVINNLVLEENQNCVKASFECLDSYCTSEQIAKVYFDSQIIVIINKWIDVISTESLLLVGSLCLSLEAQKQMNNSLLHKKVLQNLESTNVQQLANCFYALSGLCFNYPQITQEVYTGRMAIVILDSFNNSRHPILIETACSMLCNLTYKNDKIKHQLRNDGLIIPLIRVLFVFKEVTVLKQILRVIGNLCYLKENSQIVVEQNFLHDSQVHLSKLTSLTCDVLEIYSNIGAHQLLGQEQATYVIKILSKHIYKPHIVISALDCLNSMILTYSRFIALNGSITIITKLLKMYPHNLEIVFRCYRIVSNLASDQNNRQSLIDNLEHLLKQHNQQNIDHYYQKIKQKLTEKVMPAIQQLQLTLGGFKIVLFRKDGSYKQATLKVLSTTKELFAQQSNGKIKSKYRIQVITKFQFNINLDLQKQQFGKYQKQKIFNSLLFFSIQGIYDGEEHFINGMTSTPGEKTQLYDELIQCQKGL